MQPDLVVGWVREKSIQHCADQLETFERLGVPVLNPARMLLQSHSHYLKSVLLHAARVPHLPLVAGRNVQAVIDLACEAGYPVVAKPIVSFSPPDGPAGGAIMFDDEGTLREFLGERAASQLFYMQSQLRRPGQKFRVFCVNHRPVVSLLTAHGRRPTLLDPAPRDVVNIAEQASRAVAGWTSLVDIVEDLDGGCPRVTDVSVCPRPDADLVLTGARSSVLLAQADFLVAAVSDGLEALAQWLPPRASMDTI
ncbi:ATP-grasp domain-containing protein [Streptomyces prunicolor]